MLPLGLDTGENYWPEAVEVSDHYAAAVGSGGLEVWQLEPWPPVLRGSLECNCWDAGVTVEADPALAALTQGQRVRLVNLETGQDALVHRFTPPPEPTSVVGAKPQKVEVTAASPSGRYVAAGWGDPSALSVWDTKTEQETRLALGPGPVARISWVASDRYVLVEVGASEEDDGHLLQVEVEPATS